MKGPARIRFLKGLAAEIQNPTPEPDPTAEENFAERQASKVPGLARDATLQSIDSVAIIGAGTMGSGIAGQIANSGQEVLLLDLPKDEPNFLTNQAVKNLIKSDPPSLMHKDRADFIKTGNIFISFKYIA